LLCRPSAGVVTRLARRAGFGIPAFATPATDDETFSQTFGTMMDHYLFDR